MRLGKVSIGVPGNLNWAGILLTLIITVNVEYTYVYHCTGGNYDIYIIHKICAKFIKEVGIAVKSKPAMQLDQLEILITSYLRSYLYYVAKILSSVYMDYSYLA